MKALSMVIMLMLLGVIAGGAMLESATITRYFDRNRSDFRDRETMKELLDILVRRFNILVNLDADDELNPVLQSISNGYNVYGLTIRDISSGCNLNFLPDSFLSDPVLTKLLFTEGNAESFINFRRTHGFVTEISSWKPFLKNEALRTVVCYGWFSTAHIDSETCRMLAASFGKPTEELFPMVNDLPLINVNIMDHSLIAPLISNRQWKITGAAAKADALKNRLGHGPVNEGELRSILDVAENHEIYKLLGVRTAFWGISFIKDRYRMDAIIAAVPERGSNIITRYILIEGKLSRAV